MTTGKTIALTRRTFVGKVTSLLFNMLSRLFIAFLPKSKCCLISWLQSQSAVILEPKKIKPVTVSSVPHLFALSDGTRYHDLRFWMLSFNPAFSLSSFTFIKHLFGSSLLSAIKDGIIFISEIVQIGFPRSSDDKESSCNAGDLGSIHGSGRSTGEGIGYLLLYSWAFLVAQLVKNPPAIRKT